MKTDECKSLSYIPKAILKNHSIVVKREQRGLHKILRELKKSLEDRNHLYIDELKKRKPADWIQEWKHFHNLLFKEVLQKRGKFRNVDVRFGSPSDEALYRIPNRAELRPRLEAFAGPFML